MKAIIFGLGSIGQRHMRLLQTYFHEVDLWHYNRYALEPYFEKLVDSCRWEALPLGVIYPDDFSVISTPSEAHLSCARACAEMCLNLFIEKPICTNSDGLDDLIRTVRAKNLVSYVAYVLRFHPFIEYLKNNPLDGPYRFVCHSNAERWPSARKLNHVVWELSHEIDLAEYLLGSTRRIRGNCTPDGRRASLVCDHAGGASSEFSLRLDAEAEQRFISIGGHDYPLGADDNLYLRQWCHFVNRLRRKAAGKYAGTRNDLATAAGLFRRMEAFVNRVESCLVASRRVKSSHVGSCHVGSGPVMSSRVFRKEV